MKRIVVMRWINSFDKFNEEIEWTPEIRSILSSAKEDIRDIFIDSLEDGVNLQISSYLVENVSSGEVSLEITLSLFKGESWQRRLNTFQVNKSFIITDDFIESILRFFNYCGVGDESALDDKVSMVETIKKTDEYKSSNKYTYLDILNNGNDLIGESFVEVYIKSNLPINTY